MGSIPKGLTLILSLAFALVARSALPQESEVQAFRSGSASAARSWETAFALGRALRRAGHLDDADATLRRGLTAFGGQPRALVALTKELANVYMDRHNVAGAFGTCKRLGDLPGEGADGHACTARVHLVSQRASLALDEVAEALAIDASCFDAKLAEGRAYQLELDERNAERALRQALALRPDDSEAHLALGSVLWNGDRRDEGLGELRKAVQLDPAGPDGLFRLAQALSPGAESLGLLDRVTRERPTWTPAWVALGTQQLSFGRPEEAKVDADRAMRLDPANADARILLGRVALLDGRADDAIKAGQAVHAILPNSASAELLIADGNAKKGETALAVEAYEVAWSLDHHDPTPLVRASQVYHASGRDTSARAFGLKATKEAPRWAPGWEALGDALAAQGDRAAARDAYSRALAASDGAVDRASIRSKLAAIPR